jgi:acyl-CoA thioesterase I
MESRLRVRVYGDSLALPRPGVVGNDERYVALLEEWWRSRGEWVELLDRSRPNQTVLQARTAWSDDNAYFGKAVDVAIVHVGICDCAPRPLKPYERAFVSRLPAAARESVVKLVHRFRPQLVQARTIRVVPVPEFRAAYRAWLPEVVANAKRTYVLDIAPTNAQMEERSPGFMESIRAYNDIIRETVSELGGTLIGVHAAIAAAPNIDDWVVREDGHHITPRTHRAVFEQIRDRELSVSSRAS